MKLLGRVRTWYVEGWLDALEGQLECSDGVR